MIQLLVREGAKTFIIFMRADSIAVNTGTSNHLLFLLSSSTNILLGAIQYLVANGLTMIKHVWINVSSVDATASSNAVKAAVNEHLPGVQADESSSITCSSLPAHVTSPLAHHLPTLHLPTSYNIPFPICSHFCDA